MKRRRKSDEEIRKEVEEELRWESSIDHDNVAVVVRDGVVRLLGFARGYAQQLLAEQAALRVPGVLDVLNEIQIKVSHRDAHSDLAIARAVRQALEWNALVPNERIQSSVSDGWVTLRGEVSHLREKRDAERVVSELVGVRGLSNGIRVVGPEVEPAEVRDRIERALARRAARGVKHIRVAVEGGTVTLSGKVDSWAERRAVLGIVGHAPGVQEVNDGLEIDPLGADAP